MSTPRQPFLHDQTVVLRAPSQAWSAHDGTVGASPIHGYIYSDVRVISEFSARIGDRQGETVATVPNGADSVVFVAAQRHLDDRMPDPRVRSFHSRRATTTGITETMTLESDLSEALDTHITLSVRLDLTGMDRLRNGLGAEHGDPVARVSGDVIHWADPTIAAELSAPGAHIIALDSGVIEITWPIAIDARSAVTVEWGLSVTDTRAVLRGVDSPASWSAPDVTSADNRLALWLTTALSDLDALRLTTTSHPDDVFLAAGAPWFFTLFGRDSLWAARMLLPLGTDIARGTLRVLAGLQGTESVADTAEQPGKIMHELRRDELPIHGDGYLPPLYFGTVDATPLWVCLLHDAWKWGLADDDVCALMPQLVSALEWMRDFGDADGDGLLEYVDETGHGLANQGWKDSGDSVQWRDGTLADGPIALCEVQAYAFEAAMHGADLLDHFGMGGGSEWRAWATNLQSRFNAEFWIDSPDGAYPAIALDAAKRPVDTVTSNLGHLLGTGLLTTEQSALIARRLVSPEMSSGYGLRTMSTDSSGYWPLSYHGGSVWTHDTAIAITGLARDGFSAEALELTRGLLAAASGFDYRMPELHSGDPASSFARPMPYPAACRPQAWSAAASVAVLSSLLGLDPDARSGVLGVSPAAGGLAPLRVDGIRFGGSVVSITLDANGEISAASGATIEVR
jgi:glycogen debranching enzyme